MLQFSLHSISSLAKNSSVPYYQPETAYKIFQRAMFHTDIATGEIAIKSRQQLLYERSFVKFPNQEQNA
jgi:hypothetical protein